MDVCKVKIKINIYRAEGGIEPLGYYTATDLKSAHLTREDHPRILYVIYMTQVGFKPTSICITPIQHYNFVIMVMILI